MDFLHTLEALLKQDPRLLAEDGSLLKEKAQALSARGDEGLLALLLSNTEAKAHFFTRAGDTWVFHSDKFSWAVTSRSFLPDSFTRYAGKIGLATSEGRLAAGEDTCLVWPYKDCVLEGGQTKEDQKQDEVFYNETLAPDRIHRLLSPKVLAGAIRHTAGGVSAAVELTATDNLVLQGNNLMALASLRERYRGQVACIYIDPPYNTGSDTFGYNDRFRRSTWLTFLKNRLEIAWDLLSEEGAIYVQLDYNQVHYAKVLLDELFGEENFQREIIWRIGWVSGYKTAANNYIRNHDTILFYSKNHRRMRFFKQYIPNADFLPRIKDGKKFRDALQMGGFTKPQANALLEEVNHVSRPDRYPLEDVWNGSEYDDLNSIAITSFSGETVSKMLDCGEVKGQKSEKLIARILEHHTQPGDLVLDFFAGSGTTAAVAHKMGRRYIVCEQLEAHVQTTVARLTKVMQGEQSGISLRYGWAGGGSFVSCTLLEENQAVMAQIQQAHTDSACAALLSQLRDSGLLARQVDPRILSPEDPDFLALSLSEKHRLLAALVNKNHLYASLWDMEDAACPATQADKAFTHSFYGRD